ncbi:hypothetical protein MMC18_006841 [Xylographa bjoerkii]|nr:hypothetical protein [Xylographa bjoerkii]
MDMTASGLATLAIRPPTPPHEVDIRRDAALSENTPFSKHFIRPPLDTPEESPSSSADYFSRSSERTLKRVDFLSDNSNLLTRASKSIIALGKDVRALPPSKDCKPPKSILKPYKYNIPSAPVSEQPEHTIRSFSRMLEDVIRELSSSSRSSRLDAYRTLNGCLKTYDDTPDPEALVDKLPLLTDFIRRDLCSEASEKVVLDTQLVTQALKLLAILLWTPKLADMLQDDFRIFILNQSIKVIGDPSSSKTIVNHYMHLVATQKFRSKIMNNDRANRLLNVLGEITSHVKGNGVVGQRLMIYRTLLTQANALMVSRVNDWIDHLFSGMLSNIKEVRSRALAFGFDASITWGTMSHVSRSVLEIFNRQSPEGKMFSDVLVHRLNDMLNSQEEGVHVPQIWSVVILFLRSRRSQLEHWEYMRVWLVIIQKCFNSTDNQIKLQAHISWNRLIFAISPTVSTGSSMVKMLRQPIAAQLDRKSSDKHSKQAKQIAYASYCTLIYYALRPGSSHECLDRFWAEYIAQLLVKTDTNFACEVLSFLLGDSHQSAWTENRANDGPPIKPEEFARLDPQWVRAKSMAVLKVLEPLLLTADWESSDASQPWVLQAWRGFTKALGDAGSKEVKVSTETLSAMAEMINSMKRVLTSKQDGSPSDTSIGVRRLATLVNIAIHNLGPIPFAERRIIYNSGELFEAADTPSSRAPRAQGYLASPMIHLISMVLNCVKDAEKDYEDTLRDFIQIALRSATSRHSKLRILREIVHLMTPDLLAADANNFLWSAVSEVLMTLTPTLRSDETAASSPQQAGQDYREMLKIMEFEAQFSTTMNPSWAATFEHVNIQVMRECGVGGSVLAIIEPFASFLQRVPSKSYDQKTIQQITVLLRNTRWPDSRKDLERAQRALWGSSSVPIRSTSLGPFDGLFGLLDDVLDRTYTSLDAQDFRDINHLFQATTSFISSCPVSASTVLLKRIQSGLACWIKDAEGHMNSEDRSSPSLYLAILETWTAISQLTSNLPRFDTKLLLLLEPLINASLSSRHKGVVNRAIDLWNNTFGLATDLEYPPSIVVTLRRLRLVADILTSSLITNSGESIEVRTFSQKLDSVATDALQYDSTPFNFIETPEASKESLPEGDNCSQNSIEKSQIQPIEHREETAKMQPELLCNVAKRTSTPSPRRQHMTGTPVARLRHDDSQIQFAAIDSSPSCSDAMESQFLTERQREVKKRQHQEAAAMFPDIRSSPRPKSRDCVINLPRLHLGLNRDMRSRTPADEGVSPTLPAPNDLSNTYLGSSPTPSSSAKRSSRIFYEDGPPSSPPLPEPNRAKEKTLPSTSQDLLDRVGKILANTIADHQNMTTEGKEWIGDAYLNEIGAVTKQPGTDTKPLDEHELESCNASRDDGHTSAGFQNIKDYSTNVGEHDATDIPQRTPPPNGAEENGPAMLADILTNTTPPLSEFLRIDSADMIESKYHNISVDSDDEVSAQIANDMERALSQAAESSKASSPLDTRGPANNSKRKWLSMSPEPSTKRRCSSRLSGTVEISNVKEAQSTADEEMLECIVVSSPIIHAETDAGDDSGLATEISVTRGQFRVSKHTVIKKKGRPRKVVRDAVAVYEPANSITSSIELYGTSKVPKHRSTIEGESDNRHHAHDAPSSASYILEQHRHDAGTQAIQVVSTDTIVEHCRHDSEGVTTALYGGFGTDEQSEMATHTSRNDLTDRTPQNGDVEGMVVLGSSSVNSSIEAGASVSLSSPKHTKPTPNFSLTDSGVGAALPNQTVRTSADHKKGQSKAAGILENLRLMLVEAREAVLQPSEGREVISAWMDVGRVLQDAERRGAT